MNCENCKWYRPAKDDPKHGLCFMNPPSVLIDKAKNGFPKIKNFRPEVLADDPTCSGYKDYNENT